MAAISASPGLSAFFDDLVRCETRLYNAIGEQLRAEHGIVTAQFELLRYLRGNPESRVADAATRFAVGIGAISKMVDRLEARGWAARLPNPDDRRSSLISLTGSGAALVAEAERTFDEHLATLLSPAISAAQLAATAKTLAALRQSLEQAGAGLPVG